jgi:phospholipase D1/2
MLSTETFSLKPGHNCSQVSSCDALGLLVDGENYFKAARDSMMKARKRIILLAWEFHSQTHLVYEDVEDELPVELGPFINALLERNEDLEVYILVWDYSLIYMMEREWKIFSDWLNKPHPRLHLVSDTTAPSSASHHQKFLCIDDCLVFSGGMDLSISRWDTCDHLFEDERRVNPNGQSYDPYHDVNTVVTGESAKSLSQLALNRWEYATGESLEMLSCSHGDDLWPSGVEKVFTDVDLGCTVIFASPKEDPSPMEQLHMDLFSSARRLIFLENQYFSSNNLTNVLMAQFGKEEGPEVVILLPKTTSGWLVESTVGLLRDRLLEKLEEADRYDRLRIYAPMVGNDETGSKAVYVHAKVAIIDDKILKIGSANLSNRSMKVDSECDLTLALESRDERIARFRQKLLAMHQGMAVDDWASIEANHNSLVAALDQTRKKTNQQFIEPYKYGCASDVKRRLADTQLLDPDDPIDPKYWLEKVIKKKERPLVWKRILSIISGIVAAFLVGFGVVWGWGELLGQEQAIAWLNHFKDSVWAPLWLISIFVFGGVLGVPLNFMLITITLVMGTTAALLYGISGAIVSAVASFFIGRILGKPLVEKFGSERTERLSQKLGERSFRSVAFIRLIPIAPFFLINMFAGATHLNFKQYLWGTILGMTPGMCAVVFLANRAEAVVRRPGWSTILIFALLLGLLVGGVFYLKKVLYPQKRSDDE